MLVTGLVRGVISSSAARSRVCHTQGFSMSIRNLIAVAAAGTAALALAACQPAAEEKTESTKGAMAPAADAMAPAADGAMAPEADKMAPADGAMAPKADKMAPAADAMAPAADKMGGGS